MPAQAACQQLDGAFGPTTVFVLQFSRTPSSALVLVKTLSLGVLHSFVPTSAISHLPESVLFPRHIHRVPGTARAAREPLIELARASLIPRLDDTTHRPAVKPPVPHSLPMRPVLHVVKERVVLWLHILIRCLRQKGAEKGPGREGRVDEGASGLLLSGSRPALQHKQPAQVDVRVLLPEPCCLAAEQQRGLKYRPHPGLWPGQRFRYSAMSGFFPACTASVKSPGKRGTLGAVEKGPVDFLLPKRTESRLRK
jgi:hypothetical protein